MAVVPRLGTPQNTAVNAPSTGGAKRAKAYRTGRFAPPHWFVFETIMN
jgi:hypothetical protein